MSRPPSSSPTDGELEILQVLWREGPVSLSGLCQQLRRDVAATTVATMLRVMSDKRLVRRSGSGRGATWSAAVSQQTTERGMVHKMVDRLFDGAADRLVAHLVEGGQLSADQLNHLRRLLAKKNAPNKSK